MCKRCIEKRGKKRDDVDKVWQFKLINANIQTSLRRKNLRERERAMDAQVRAEEFRPIVSTTSRNKLKLLILEADEATLDRIIEAIQMVCAEDGAIKQ